MNDPEYNVERFSIVHDRDGYAIIPNDEGEWVKAEDFRFLMGDLVYKDIELASLQQKIEQLNTELLRLKSNKNLSIQCPNCLNWLEDNEMKRKQCHVCEFEWITSHGY